MEYSVGPPPWTFRVSERSDILASAKPPVPWHEDFSKQLREWGAQLPSTTFFGNSTYVKPPPPTVQVCGTSNTFNTEDHTLLRNTPMFVRYDGWKTELDCAETLNAKVSKRSTTDDIRTWKYIGVATHITGGRSAHLVAQVQTAERVTIRNLWGSKVAPFDALYLFASARAKLLPTDAPLERFVPLVWKKGTPNPKPAIDTAEYAESTELASHPERMWRIGTVINKPTGLPFVFDGESELNEAVANGTGTVDVFLSTWGWETGVEARNEGPVGRGDMLDAGFGSSANGSEGEGELEEY